MAAGHGAIRVGESAFSGELRTVAEIKKVEIEFTAT